MEKKKNFIATQLFASANTLEEHAAKLDDTQIERVLLKRLLPTLRAYEDGQKTILKKNQGTNVEWTRFNSLDDSTTTTKEGIPPTSETLKPEVISAKAGQYTRSIKMTDILLQRGKHKCKAEAAELLRESGRKTIDSIIINALAEAKKTYYGNGKTKATITANDTLKDTDIERAFVCLSDANAVRFDDGTYHALITPKSASDVRKMPGFIDKSKYQDPNGRGIIYGEIGRFNGFTFIETTNIPTADAGADNAVNCGQIFFYGKGAYGVVDVEEQGSNGRPKLIIKGLGSAGTADPANQVASAAIKFMFTAQILDEKRILKVLAPTSIVLETTDTQNFSGQRSKKEQSKSEQPDNEV